MTDFTRADLEKAKELCGERTEDYVKNVGPAKCPGCEEYPEYEHNAPEMRLVCGCGICGPWELSFKNALEEWDRLCGAPLLSAALGALEKAAEAVKVGCHRCKRRPGKTYQGKNPHPPWIACKHPACEVGQFLRSFENKGVS